MVTLRVLVPVLEVRILPPKLISNVNKSLSFVLQ